VPLNTNQPTNEPISTKFTINLAIANRLRISSAHKVTTVDFQGKVFHGEEAYGTPVVAAAVGSINFAWHIFFMGSKCL